MGAVFVGMNFVFGIPAEQKPLENPFGGKVRLRFRAQEFAEAFVRTPDCVRRFTIVAREGRWMLDEQYEIARNVTIQRTVKNDRS